MASEQFVISPRPAVRAFALAALFAVVGAVLISLSGSFGWGVPGLASGVVVLALAGVLIVLAVVAGFRQRVFVHLDDDGFRVRTPTAVQSGRWSDVTRVTAGSGRLTLHEGEQKRTHLIAPSGSSADLDALAHAISARLDTDRGYTTFTG